MQRLIAPRYLVAEAETVHHWTPLLSSRGYMLRFLQNRPLVWKWCFKSC